MLTSLLNVTDSWFSNADKQKINISIFLDVKKALEMRITKFCDLSYQIIGWEELNINGLHHT